MIEVKNSDWKLFRKKLPVWQENYIKKLNEEYIQILQKEGSAAENFWELEKRMYQDKRKTSVAADMRRSVMIRNILDLINEGAITLDDLNEFSEELKENIASILRF